MVAAYGLSTKNTATPIAMPRTMAMTMTTVRASAPMWPPSWVGDRLGLSIVGICH